MTAATLVLDAVLDPGRAEIVVQREPTLRAAFTMTGMPRVESLLLGRPVASVPTLVERLCGICPASHHLAGIRALEAVLGLEESSLPAGAVAVRRLLHHASVLGAHAERLVWVEADLAAALRRLARAAEVAAGGPGHFPVCAVPGGVRSLVDAEEAARLAAGFASTLPRLAQVVARMLDDEAAPMAEKGPAWSGVDVALVAADGSPDLLGPRLRVVTPDASEVTTVPPSQWSGLVAEAAPGSSTPRPFVRSLGEEAGRLRVGPISQLLVGPLRTPAAAASQARWLDGPRTAGAARGVIALHCLEVLAELTTDPALIAGPEPTVSAGPSIRSVTAPPPSGTGWIDGQRGLLSHSYSTDADGVLVAAQILTPTASNEAWLAHLLTSALAQGSGEDAPPLAALEAAIREADPCLPCTSTPPGAMSLTLRDGA